MGIEDDLAQDREEARLDGEPGVSENAAAACIRLAGILDLDPETKNLAVLTKNWAVFGEGDGVAALVIRSDITGRRVDFRISADGLDITVISIDKSLSTATMHPAIDDHVELRKISAWVHGDG